MDEGREMRMWTRGYISPASNQRNYKYGKNGLFEYMEGNKITHICFIVSYFWKKQGFNLFLPLTNDAFYFRRTEKLSSKITPSTFMDKQVH